MFHILCFHSLHVLSCTVYTIVLKKSLFLNLNSEKEFGRHWTEPSLLTHTLMEKVEITIKLLTPAEMKPWLQDSPLYNYKI